MIKATVTWFDFKSGIGIAEDHNGNEFYLSDDCCPKDLKTGDTIVGVPKSYGKTIGLISVKRA